jgi:hypothetical protein
MAAFHVFNLLMILYPMFNDTEYVAEPMNYEEKKKTCQM